nr:MAG TPA: hypothetical protein [Caudoviricetes sp.]
MEDDDIEILFNHINSVEDEIDNIEDSRLYEYVVNCITNNEYCTMEDFEEF